MFAKLFDTHDEAFPGGLFFCHFTFSMAEHVNFFRMVQS
jgi:hypothetical protein